MEVIVQDDPQAISKQAARSVGQLLRKKPQAVLGLATGATMIPFYRELVRMHCQEGLDFSRAVTFNLDEYVGLSPENPSSFHRFMWDHLFSQVNIQPQSVHIPDGQAEDLAQACSSYEEEIRRQGGIDLQFLGIGCNGHIGFNEPYSPLRSRTRAQTLSLQTVQINQRHFGTDREVPRRVLTMGIGTILESRRCLLLACGESKALAVAAAVEGPLTPMLPASALQLHPRTRFIIDRSAASKLTGTRYRSYAQRAQS